jgi:hypothetical protein
MPEAEYFIYKVEVCVAHSSGAWCQHLPTLVKALTAGASQHDR